MAASRDGVDPVLGRQDVEAGLAEAADGERVAHQRPEAGHGLLEVGEAGAVADVVEGEGDVAELLGDAAGASLGVVVDAGTLVRHQHAGTCVVPVGQGEEAHRPHAVDVVLDLLGLHVVLLVGVRSCHGAGRDRPPKGTAA